MSFNQPRPDPNSPPAPPSRFFGFRLLVRDKWTRDIRFEQVDLTVLMNIHSRKGRAFAAGVEFSDPDTVTARLEQGYRAWINDSYWLVMPTSSRTPASPCATAACTPSILPGYAQQPTNL